MAASSFGKEPRVLITLRKVMFSDSTAFRAGKKRSTASPSFGKTVSLKWPAEHQPICVSRLHSLLDTTQQRSEQ